MKVWPWCEGGIFGEDFVAAVAVDADGGGGDEEFGASFGGEVGEEGGEFFGGGDAGVPEFLAGFLGPAGGDVFSGEVDERCRRVGGR